MNPFQPVKDSTLWFKKGTLQVAKNTDSKLYIGVVRSSFNVKSTGELRYVVEVRSKNDVVMTTCRMLRRFGGVYNYEDYVLQDYNFNAGGNSQNGSEAKAGDVVLIGKFGGQGREGVILGGLSHPAKRDFLKTSDGPQYKSEFNGVETHINKEGEYVLTFRGIQTNISALKDAPDKPVPAPKYDEEVGTSFFKLDKTGSIHLNDNAKEDLQKLFINKPDGTVELISGKVSLKFSKGPESVELKTKTTDIDSTDSIDIRTKATTLNSSDTIDVTTKSTKWASSDIIDVSTKATKLDSSSTVDVKTKATVLDSSSAVDIKTTNLTLTASASTVVNSAMIELGGNVEPAIKGLTYTTAETAFLAAVAAFCSTIVAPGPLTPAHVTAAAALNAAASAFSGALAGSLSTKVKVG